MLSETIFLGNRLYLYYTKQTNFYIKMDFTTTKKRWIGSVLQDFDFRNLFKGFCTLKFTTFSYKHPAGQ